MEMEGDRNKTCEPESCYMHSIIASESSWLRSSYHDLPIMTAARDINSIMLPLTGSNETNETKESYWELKFTPNSAAPPLRLSWNLSRGLMWYEHIDIDIYCEGSLVVIVRKV
jgi:hypothetical protein